MNPSQPSHGNEHPCPLCNDTTRHYHSDRHRDYWHCSHCDFIHVPACFHLDAKGEKDIYDLHQNDSEDEGYRHFLDRALAPLLEKLTAPAQGLDFGSGPGPTLALMAQEAGFQCEVYDLYYAHHPERLRDHFYDFVITTEVIEHLAHPAQQLELWLLLLKYNGWLCIMTKRHRGREAFKRWHYTHDLTHIGFYSEQTFLWLAKHYQLILEFPAVDVVILRKTAGTHR